MPITPSGAQVWRDYVTDGVPASGAHKVLKNQVRAWSQSVESLLDSVTTAAAIFDTRANLYATLTYAANTLAWVVSDSTTSYNGIYRKTGGVGVGSWSRVAELPYSFVKLSDAGAGTANVIQLTSDIPTSSSMLRIANVFETNTGNVTVSENGAAAKPLLTNSGNQIVSGGLVSGMMISYVDDGTSFRLLSDQASAAIQTAAEAAAADAEAAAIAAADYAALALNNFVRNTFVGTGSETDFTLTVDPGSANNMFVNVNGVLQAISAYTLEYVSTVPTLRFSSAPPDGVEIDVRFGSKITVGTPSDGSITTAKIGADAVTADKMSAADAAAILAKIGAAASGAAITNSQMPTGAVVASSYAEYVANANLTAQIPRDDTIPQIGEGTEILSVTITPKSTTNKLRCRFQGVMAKSSIGNVVSAIFATGTGISGTPANARAANNVTTDTVDYSYPVSLEAEFVPATLNAVTVSVRVGPDATGGTLRLNGTSAARFFGGASKSTLVVEEIKA